MKFYKDSFDSEIFGIEAYKIELDKTCIHEEIVECLNSVSKGFICCFSPMIIGHIRILESLNFKLISIRNRYKYNNNVIKNSDLPEDYKIVSSENYEMKAEYIDKLAISIGQNTRYFKDELINRNLAKSLYVQWIKNSLFNGFSARSFILEYKSSAVGICTTKKKLADGEIDLLGIIEEHSSKGLGKQLLVSAIEYLQEQQCKQIYVTTAGENIPANKLFQKNNFIIDSVNTVFHKHIYG